ncbi:MAG: E3 binding domain-containing protein, partial [Actinomycetia bacterium]|nr:E3 binding domain-containing protein [Actinomycetes bacterium]
MTHQFRLPDIGEGLTGADIMEWFVAVGDEVAIDQTIVEIETAKTTVEITATHAGTVLSLGGSPGESIAVGDVLFVIGEEGHQPSAISYQPEKEEEGPSDLAALSHLPRQAEGGAVRAMPIVRKLAKKRGIDLATVSGTGPGGA